MFDVTPSAKDVHVSDLRSGSAPSEPTTSISRGRVRAEVLPVGGHEHLVMRAPQVVHVLPIDAEGVVTLVRQFRPALGHEILEAPAGGIDAGETPEQAAARELGEETGLRAGSLEHLGSFATCPGITDEIAHFFLARQVTPDPDAPAPDADERIEIEHHHPSEIMIGAPGASEVDAKTMLLLHLAMAR